MHLAVCPAHASAYTHCVQVLFFLVFHQQIFLDKSSSFLVWWYLFRDNGRETWPTVYWYKLFKVNACVGRLFVQLVILSDSL